MTPSADFLQAVSKRLWMRPSLRDERLEELASHISQREAERGLSFTSADAVASVMGTPRTLATELNRAIPWRASRPAKRLYLTPLWMLAAGYVAMLLLDALMNQFAEQRGSIHIINGAAAYLFIVIQAIPTVLCFGIPVGVALTARRLCVRPLHAALPLALPLLIAMFTALPLLNPGQHAGMKAFYSGLSLMAMAMQYVVLLTIFLRPARAATGWSPALLLLPIVPLWTGSTVAACIIHGSQVPLDGYPPLIEVATGALVSGAAIAIPAWMLARSLRSRSTLPLAA